MKHIICLVSLYLALTLSASAATLEQRTFRGTVVRVSDADTISVHVPGWPMPFDPAKVRLDGLDTPETVKGLYKCAKEMQLGLAAKAWLKSRLPIGSRVKLIWTGKSEKYGRLLALVYSGRENLNISLIQHGFAVSYHGGKKQSWCGP